MLRAVAISTGPPSSSSPDAVHPEPQSAPAAVPDDRVEASWDCRHARNEVLQAMVGVYIGFGSLAATASTGVGIAVSGALTGAAIGDVAMKSDAADHACRTGAYRPR